MSRNRLLDLLDGYEEHSYATDDGKSAGKRFLSHELSGAQNNRMRKMLSSPILRLFHGVSKFLSEVSAKAFGTVALSFGLVTLIIYLVGLSRDQSLSSGVTGIVFAVFSIPFLLTDKPMPDFFSTFVLTDFIFFEFFCIKRVYSTGNGRKFSVILAILLGIIPAALGVILPVWQICAGVGGLVFIYLAFLSPEFAFFASILSLPYLALIPSGDIYFSATVLVGFLSFMRKVIYGKRVIFLEQYDLFLSAMLGMVLVSGIFIKGADSFKLAAEMLILAMGYALTGNLLTNRRLADRTAVAIVISSIPPSVLSLVTLGIAINEGRAAEIKDVGISSTFAQTDAAAAFFIVAVVFSAALVKQAHGNKKLLPMLILLMNLTSLVLTGEVFALFALLLGLVVYCSLKTNKWAALLIPILFLLPYAVLLLPSDWLAPLAALIPSIDSFSELFAAWRAALAVIADNAVVGIGIGAEALSDELAAYGTVGGKGAMNLFIELGLEAGVIALSCFVLMLVIRLRHRTRYFPYIKNSQVATLSPISSVCVFCLVAYGAVSYIFADLSVYYLFWCIFGMGSAAMRIAKKEYDDRVLYYRDISAHDSSVIDIEIR